MNRKYNRKSKPITMEDAIKCGMVRIITDPKEIETIRNKEQHIMGFKNHTDKVKSRTNNEYKYSDVNYSIDSKFKGMIEF